MDDKWLEETREHYPELVKKIERERAYREKMRKVTDIANKVERAIAIGAWSVYGIAFLLSFILWIPTAMLTSVTTLVLIWAFNGRFVPFDLLFYLWLRRGDKD